MKIVLFLDIIRRYETLVPMSNFHAIPQQLGCHSHLSRLNDDICSYLIWSDKHLPILPITYGKGKIGS